MPEPKTLEPEQIGMLIDTSLCISLFLLAKVCTNKEIDIFFKGNVIRLEQQGFSDKQISKHLKNTREIVDNLKKGF